MEEKDTETCDMAGTSSGTENPLPNVSTIKEEPEEELSCVLKPYDTSKTLGGELIKKEQDESRLKAIKNKFTCSFCGKEFTTKQKRKDHERIHTDKVQCPICNNFYLKIKRHMRAHENNMEFRCKLCPKVFKTEDYLKRHVKFHGQTETCDICGATVDADRMRDHLHRHKVKQMEKIYNCEICPKKFPRMCDLNDHLREHNGTRRKTPQKPKPTYKANTKTKSEFKICLTVYECDICGHIVTHKTTLKVHMDKTHVKKEKKTFECKLCDKIVLWRGKTKHLKRHLLKQKKEAIDTQTFIDGQPKTELDEVKPIKVEIK